QRATGQKEQLEATAKIINLDSKIQTYDGSGKIVTNLQAGKLQKTMKTELLELSLSNADPHVVQERTSKILIDHLSSVGANAIDNEARRLLTSELSGIVNQFDYRDLAKERRPFTVRPISAEVLSRDDLLQTKSQHLR
nr:hypothetical protein [Pyrinomonadaceae bacterium]